MGRTIPSYRIATEVERSKWKLFRERLDRKDTFSIIHDNGDEEIVSRYCHHCMEYGFYNRLGHKILINDERPAPDHDKWCQCIQCGHIYAIHETT